MTELFVKGMLFIAIAVAVLCVILAVIELVRTFMGKDND